MSIITDYLAEIILAIGLAAFLVSVMTQVTKRLAFMNKVPTDLQIVILSLVISFVGFLAYASYTNMVITWYYIAGVFFGAFIVAFVSMYGWSKLKSIYGRLVTNNTGTETGTTAATDTAVGTGITTATNTVAGTGIATATDTAAGTGTTTATTTAAGTGTTTATTTAAGTGITTTTDTAAGTGTATAADTTTATDTAAETNTSTEAASSGSGGDTQAK